MATNPALRILLPRGRYMSKYNSARIDRTPYATRKQLDLRRYASYTMPPPPRTLKRVPKGQEKTSQSNPPKVLEKTSQPNPPKVLEKPSKFNPPSHPARIDRPPPRHFPGPQLSPQQAEVRKKKRYPNMLPPEGSFMYWFLSNKKIHMYITLVQPPTPRLPFREAACTCAWHARVFNFFFVMSAKNESSQQSVLFSLATITSLTTYQRTTPFAHFMPPADSSSLAHPIKFIYQHWLVYKLHALVNSHLAQAKRRKAAEDVEKRRAYRKAHGIERLQQGPLPWFGLAPEEGEEGDKSGSPDGAAEKGTQQASSSEQTGGVPQPASAAADATAQPEVYKDWEGRRKPVKRWLGIWT